MKSIKNFYTISRIFFALMLASLLAGFIFMFSNNLDFIIEALNQGKFNVPNIAYSLLKLVIGIFLPCAFLVPFQSDMGRINSAKIVFIVYGALYILTASWIFAYFGSDIGDITKFQSQNLYVSQLVLWDTYSAAGSIYSVLYGILCIFTGLSVDDNKKKVCALCISLPVVRLLLPIITNIICGNGILSVLWITNNYAEIISLIFFAIAFSVAASHDVTWINLIWNQDVENNTDDELI